VSGEFGENVTDEAPRANTPDQMGAEGAPTVGRYEVAVFEH
jgi:hypothetical protein